MTESRLSASKQREQKWLLELLPVDVFNVAAGQKNTNEGNDEQIGRHRRSNRRNVVGLTVAGRLGEQLAGAREQELRRAQAAEEQPALSCRPVRRGAGSCPLAARARHGQPVVGNRQRHTRRPTGGRTTTPRRATRQW
jgi:hypothetical protein